MSRKYFLLPLSFALFLDAAIAQSSATLRGEVVDPTENALAGASVRLSHPLSGFERDTVADASGKFRFSNLPFHGYVLEIKMSGFREVSRNVELRTNVPVDVRVTLGLALQQESVSVSTSGPVTLLDTQATGTKTQLSAATIEKLPVATGARGLESLLLGFPGFAANANGSIHPRGAHNQLTYVVDGMPISDQFTGQFATSIDPNLVQTLELFTGNIPPEFGSKISGVVNVTTRSGFDGGGRSFGQVDLGGGGFDTVSQAAQVGGSRGRLGWFASVSNVKSNRFLDSPSFDNLHNGGNAQRGSSRVDFHMSPRDLLRFSAMAGRSSFQLANLRSQHANGQQQRRMLDDISFSVGYVRVLSPSMTFDSTTSYRETAARLMPSPGDIPVTADLSRSLATLSSLNRLNWQRGSHQLRAGFDAQLFQLGEAFAFALTDPAFNDPAGTEHNPNLVPFDLSRGGAWFRFREQGTGRLLSCFLHDRMNWRGFILDLGLRYDRYSMVVNADEFQPRIGFAYHLASSGTVFRASYNRNFQTPPNENLLLANSVQSAYLAPPAVRRTLNGGVIPIQPEYQNVYEAGLQQDLGGRASLDLVYYHKNSENAQDNDNFLNTGIIFPTSLASSRVNGFEASLRVPEARRLSGSLTFTHFRAIVNPPFTGGLFLGSAALDALSEGPFVIDHDQALGMSGNLIYRLAKRWWTSWQLRYDSGLVSNPSDPDEVAADIDYYDQLPYVDLLGDPPRIRPRGIVDASLGYEHYRGDRRAWEVVLQVSNLTNQRGLYSFQSVFVGTRVVQAFTASARLRVFW